MAWGIDQTGALAAWGAHGARGQGAKVAVLDTGVDSTHPELVDRVTAFAEFDVAGNRTGSSAPRDSGTHGTHVVGTIAGGNSAGEWIGVAPLAKLLVGLVLDDDAGGSDAQILAGIDWALESGADVINMSLGGLTLGLEPPTTYAQAIMTCVMDGVPVVTAIGNDGSQTSGTPGNDLLALSVGAIDSADSVAGFSGGRTQLIRNSPVLDPSELPLVYSTPKICAPGVAVRSCIAGGGYDNFCGTSMATPHVSGAVALILSATNRLNAVSRHERAFLIEDILTSSVRQLGESGQDHRYGWGALDALAAIGFARSAGL